MRPKTLKFKVSAYVAISLIVVMLVFTLLVIRYQRTELLHEAVRHVNQLSEVIIKSTRFAMLQNQPDYVSSIIQDVSKQKGIAKVRVLNKDGEITHSTYLPELGLTVDRKAEGCFQCHKGETPSCCIERGDEGRVFTAADGGRLLGSMSVIRNEPSCYTAACHEHNKGQSVLGVLDIVYSLDEIDRAMWKNTITIVIFSLGFIIISSLLVGVFVRRLVYTPLHDLEAGAKRLRSGNLEQLIPVRSDDECGQLATSFNTMTVALKNSRVELQELARTLEEKVEDRTRQLRISQAETARGEKLASVGLLAAGIAHELNNPLTGILTFSHLIRKKFPDESQEAEDMDLVIRETKRCATIIRRLLDFAREKAQEMKFADINQIIENTAHLIEWPAHLSDIAISMDLEPDLPPVWVDEDLISQVILNMLTNAQHAIAEKGSITLRSRLTPIADGAEPDTDSVPMVQISIIDTGCGIPEQDLQRIFDPFFTTKEVGRGTGLGLSISYGIVTSHGGTIEVESTVGKGTTFRINLPINPRNQDAAETVNGGGE
ncbi:MAG: ATP-binding protein [Gammaproteobacteria bacterium]|nr:ATP-binding protein [Gammaproteobacteria bacterium]